jgi:hypothetical protein
MARKPHRDDDDDRNLDEPEEEAAHDDETAETVPVPTSARDEDEAEAEEERADEERADDEPPKRPADEEAEDVDLPPRARTPIFTIVLLILNLLLVPVFLLLLVLDYNARQQWSHATFLNWVAAYGLPFNNEEDNPPAAFLSRPRLRLDSDELKKAYGSRPKAPGTPGVNEPFVPVDTFDMPMEFYIRKSQIDDRVKRDLFKDVGNPVTTLDEEVTRLKNAVPSQIEQAVTRYVGAVDPAKKKAAVEHLLLPMAWSTAQIDQLQNRIDEASKDPAKLDELLRDAVERRILADALGPLNIYRPDEGVTLADVPKDAQDKGEFKKFTIEKIASIDDYSIADLRALLQKRFDDALKDKDGGKDRDDVDRRHQIAFLLLTLSQLKAPDGQLLLDRQFDRSQVVCGLYEFAQAAANYPRTLEVLRNRVVHAIAVDRQGYVVPKGPTTVLGFVDRLGSDIERLRKVKSDIDFTIQRIKDLEAQRDRYDKDYNERLLSLTEITKKLVSARAVTAQKRTELNQLQQELFDAQQYLSDAADRNAELLKRILDTEKALQTKESK